MANPSLSYPIDLIHDHRHGLISDFDEVTHALFSAKALVDVAYERDLPQWENEIAQNYLLALSDLMDTLLKKHEVLEKRFNEFETLGGQ